MTTALASAPTLTALDRCDRCGARARVRAVLPAGDLLFCDHHARRHGEALARVAVSLDRTRPYAT